MKTAQIREELHKYINEGDDRFLRIVHAIATNYCGDVDYTKPGSPMDEETYRERIQRARERVKAGYFTTSEELDNEMEQWEKGFIRLSGMMKPKYL